jgi:hypothetical protein
MKGWISTAIIGLIIIILQLMFPDPVPDYLNSLLALKHIPSSTGLEPAIKVALFLYTISGIATFITGIVGSIIAFRRNQFN